MKPKKASKDSRREKTKEDVRDADDAGDEGIPTLTEVVAPGPGDRTLSDETLTSLHAEIATSVLKLAEELLHSASREMEAMLLEKVGDQLRAQLPELIEAALRAPFPEQTIK